MSAIRLAHKKRFISISNALAQNNNLSLRARGLMLYLLSLPDDWVIHVNHLVKTLKEGRCSILNAIKELKECGYIHIAKTGFKEGWEYFVFEEPTSDKDFKLFLRTNRFPNSSVSELFANQQLQNTKEIYTKEINSTNVPPRHMNVSFSFKLNNFVGIDEAQIAKWKKAFPKIDIPQELEKARKWVINNPTRNKKRKNWNLLLEEEWFPRASEALNNKSSTKTHVSNNKAIYDRLKPIYDRYMKWFEQLNDPCLIDKGSIVLKEDHFYESKFIEGKYHLDYDKFINLLIKYKVPERIFKENAN